MTQTPFTVRNGLIVNTGILVACSAANSVTSTGNSHTIIGNVITYYVNNFNLSTNSFSVNVGGGTLTLNATSGNVTINATAMTLNTNNLTTNSTTIHLWNTLFVESGMVGIQTLTPNTSLHIASIDAIQIPIGNTAQRPANTAGVLRYNSDMNVIETMMTTGNVWSSWVGSMQCGTLQIQNANAAGESNTIVFLPFRGNLIVINGTPYQIPATGVVANCNNTSIDGTGGQVLANTTLYYVYAAANTTHGLFLDFSTTGHSTSTTTGNVGREIKTGDDTRTLIGMIFTQNNWFQDSSRLRLVASWFNRKPRYSTAATGNSFTSTSIIQIGLNCYGLLWGDTHTYSWVAGNVQNDTLSASTLLQMLLAGSHVGPQAVDSNPASSGSIALPQTFFLNHSYGASGDVLSEGLVPWSIGGKVQSSGPTGSINGTYQVAMFWM